MTESISHSDVPSHKDLDPPVVEVFFDDNDSILLDAVRVRRASIDVDFYQEQYEELITVNETVLAPVSQLVYGNGDEALIDFARELEPVPDVLDGPLLRTRERSENLRLLDAVRMLGANGNNLEKQLTRAEYAEAERYHKKLEHILTYEHDLWLRLEAGRQAEKHMRGRTMIARLAYFITKLDDGHRGVPGIFPAIFSSDQMKLRLIPPQLKLHETWLYVEVDDVDEQNKV